jgi:UDP-N-acetylglucosamine:LPS N-acetylglucosamine transferase
MPFPEFAAGKRKILYFSRGRGRGHAIPDIEIAHELLALRPDADLRFVSYGLGGETLSAAGFSLIDVGLPDISPIAEMTVIAGRLIGWLRPDLVVAHEEFPVPPVAKVFDKPVVFITDYFTDPELYSMAALKFADEILFTGRAGIYAEPPWIGQKVRYVGPVLRKFAYRREDRLRARADLAISADAFVLSVFPGNWSESEAPAAELIAAAFDQLRRASKRLVWVDGRDVGSIASQLGNRQDVMVLSFYPDVDRIMCASDVVVTKSNRITAMELDHLRIPSIALSYELNLPDDQAIEALESVERLAAKDLDAQGLHDALERAAARVLPDYVPSRVSASRICAQYLDAALTRALV